MSCYILTIDVIRKINGDGMIQNANISEYTPSLLMPRQPEKDTQETTDYRLTALFTYNPSSCISLSFNI